MSKKTLTPAMLATKVDAYKALRDKRLEMQKQVDELAKEENALKTELIQLFRDSEVAGITGRLAQITLVQKTVPIVTDWEALYAHIKATGDFELLQRRLTISAVSERWEDNQDVPGVATDSYFDLSVRKPQ